MPKLIFKTVVYTSVPLEVDVWSEKLVNEHIKEALEKAKEYDWYPTVTKAETQVWEEEE